jgi:hypothetical protein
MFLDKNWSKYHWVVYFSTGLKESWGRKWLASYPWYPTPDFSLIPTNCLILGCHRLVRLLLWGLSRQQPRHKCMYQRTPWLLKKEWTGHFIQTFWHWQTNNARCSWVMGISYIAVQGWEVLYWYRRERDEMNQSLSRRKIHLKSDTRHQWLFDMITTSKWDTMLLNGIHPWSLYYRDALVD